MPSGLKESTSTESAFTEQELKDEIRRLAPFHHKVDLPHGLSTYVPELSRRKLEYTRLSNLVKHAFPSLLDACGGSLQGKRVLDIACSCGGFTVEAAKLGAEVLGVDIVDRYLEQANFIKRALNLQQVEFKMMNIEEIDESTVGQFDITFCFGILYHLENPVAAMKRLSSVTQYAMLVDTSVMRAPLMRRSYWMMNTPPVSTSESADASTSLWRSKDSVVEFMPNEAAVIALLKFLGFPRVLRLKPKTKDLEKRYYTGTRVTFLALRS